MNKLAIVGTHPDTRANAPFDDPTFDIWVFNEAPQAEWCKRWTHVFQMHKPEVYSSPLNMVRGDHWEWLQQDHGIEKTIFMQEIDPRVPNSARFPLDEIKSQLSPAWSAWFTSTAAMALALALYLGYEYIEVYGVDLSSNTEYTYQQNCWLYWVGAAKMALGDNLVLKSGEHHFHQRLYAYEGEIQITRDYFAERAAQFEAEKHRHELRLMKLKDRFNEALSKGEAQKIPDLLIEAKNTALELGIAAGAYQEANNYALREDPISRQQFERRGAQAQQDGEQLKSQMDYANGEAGYVFNAWKASGSAIALKQLRFFYDKFIELCIGVGGHLGVMRQNFEYLQEYDVRVTAAGGERTLTALGVA